MAKKPWKVEIPDHVLAMIPSEDREKVRAEILEKFANFDPKNPPGDIVAIHPIDAGVHACPACGASLERATTTTLPSNMGGETLDFLDCTGCAAAYQRPASN